MKIKATLISFGTALALALAVGLAGFSGTAAADPKGPSDAPSPVPAERRSSAEEPRTGPTDPVAVKPAYTG